MNVANMKLRCILASVDSIKGCDLSTMFQPDESQGGCYPFLSFVDASAVKKKVPPTSNDFTAIGMGVTIVIKYMVTDKPMTNIVFVFIENGSEPESFPSLGYSRLIKKAMGC